MSDIPESDCRHELECRKDGYGGYESVCKHCAETAEIAMIQAQARIKELEAVVKESLTAQERIEELETENHKYKSKLINLKICPACYGDIDSSDECTDCYEDYYNYTHKEEQGDGRS